MSARPNPTELRYSSIVCMCLGLTIGYLLADPITGAVMGVFILAAVVAGLQHGLLDRIGG